MYARSFEIPPERESVVREKITVRKNAKPCYTHTHAHTRLHSYRGRKKYIDAYFTTAVREHKKNWERLRWARFVFVVALQNNIVRVGVCVLIFRALFCQWVGFQFE